jgi:HSP20 family molecular chaperone IbpA
VEHKEFDFTLWLEKENSNLQNQIQEGSQENKKLKTHNSVLSLCNTELLKDYTKLQKNNKELENKIADLSKRNEELKLAQLVNVCYISPITSIESLELIQLHSDCLLQLKNDAMNLSDNLANTFGEFTKSIKNILIEKDDEKMCQNNIKYEFYSDLERYYIVVGLPGFTKEDIDINIKDGILYLDIKPNDNFEEDAVGLSFNPDVFAKNMCIEYGTGLDIDDNQETFEIPEADESSTVAIMKDGLLKIVIQKESQPTKIEVK